MSRLSVQRAHGRVNLIGEHTDYNGGWVLPTAIPQFTEVKIAPRMDQRVFADAGLDPKSKNSRQADYSLGEEKGNGHWIDYVQGVTSLLQQSGFQIQGFDLSIQSTVPEGSGLSSSAALEISLLKGIREAFSLSIEDLEIARLGQRVENEFVGAKTGIMDQMACSFARAGEALFLDTQQLQFRNILIPLDQLDLIVVNSGISHRLSASGGYNQRRAECESACALLGVDTLRQIETKDLEKLEILPPILKKRAWHVVTENARVHRAVAALESRDFFQLGRLFFESHESMKNDYDVSIPEIDQLVEFFREQKGVYGARLTGGGFGGSVVALSSKGAGRKIAENVVSRYCVKTGEAGKILVA